MSPCPACGADSLRIEMRLRAKTIGSFSVAGSTVKIPVTKVPFLVCDSCGIEAEGHR